MRTFKLIVGTVVVVAVGFAGYCIERRWEQTPGYMEIAQAPIWGDLQGIEFSHRNVGDLQVPMILKGAVGEENYDVLGVRSINKSRPYVWIVLNANAGANGIFSMPHDNGFALPCSYLGEIESKEKVDAKVLSELQSHCQ
jgi:hypothetical protein